MPTLPMGSVRGTLLPFFIVYSILLAFDTPVTECLQAFVLPATSSHLLSLLLSLMLFSTQHNTRMQTFSGVILQATQDCFDAQISSDRC